MPEYRRWRQTGGWYFFTVNLHDRRRDWLIRHVGLLRQAFAIIQQKRPFELDATVILPDHLHCIWKLPPNDSDFATRWRLIKGLFTRWVGPLEPQGLQEGRKGSRSVWQQRYWEHVLRDEDDYRRHVEYIHYNPVKHGYVDRPVDWPHSSIHRFIRKGLVEADWGTSDAIEDLRIE